MQSALACRAPFGIYEGAFASRNPVFTLAPSTVVGASDIAVGRFAWSDPITGEVSNAQIAGGRFGLVQPRFGLWPLTYLQPNPPGPPVRMLRAGKPCTLYTSGDFYVRFPQGASTRSTVYIDPATGIVYASQTGGLIQTNWITCQNVRPNCLGVISPYQFIS